MNPDPDDSPWVENELPEGTDTATLAKCAAACKEAGHPALQFNPPEEEGGETWCGCLSFKDGHSHAEFDKAMTHDTTDRKAHCVICQVKDETKLATADSATPEASTDSLGAASTLKVRTLEVDSNEIVLEALLGSKCSLDNPRSVPCGDVRSRCRRLAVFRKSTHGLSLPLRLRLSGLIWEEHGPHRSPLMARGLRRPPPLWLSPPPWCWRCCDHPIINNPQPQQRQASAVVSQATSKSNQQSRTSM